MEIFQPYYEFRPSYRGNLIPWLDLRHVHYKFSVYGCVGVPTYIEIYKSGMECVDTRVPTDYEAGF